MIYITTNSLTTFNDVRNKLYNKVIGNETKSIIDLYNNVGRSVNELWNVRAIIETDNFNYEEHRK